jgi:outer membrane murein-binding lipoprotein Lpp
MMHKIVALVAIATLVASVPLAGSAFAQKYEQNDLRAIADAYRNAIENARSDFQAAIKKANDDARASVEKGLPIEQINAESKAAIQNARDALKNAIEDARSDAKESLLKLKAAIDARAR